jgi:tRNA pseudouridine55 synthase
MHNILLIDKPAGITSFDVIRRMRKALSECAHANAGEDKRARIKIGHAGTLDPMATGLMIIGVGEGTKKLKEYLKLPKVYEAEVFLGLHTDTGDREGREFPISNSQFPNNLQISKLSKEKIKETLEGMVGKLILPVPRYSAIKVGGKRLYAKARRGESFEPPKKEMEVIRLTPKGIMNKELGMRGEEGITVKFEVEVASGTYIRSLAEELGRRLGVPATLWNLRRTRIGPPTGGFKVEDAEKLE